RLHHGARHSVAVARHVSRADAISDEIGPHDLQAVSRGNLEFEIRRLASSDSLVSIIWIKAADRDGYVSANQQGAAVSDELDDDVAGEHITLTVSFTAALARATLF